jgi:hypothetical protein
VESPSRRKPSAADVQLAELVGAVVNLNDRVDLVHNTIRTQNGAQRTGAFYRLVPSSSQMLSNSPGKLVGWMLHNAGAAAVVVNLRDSDDVNGDVFASFSVPIGGDSSAWLLPGGVGFSYGLFVEYPGGQPAVPLTGALYTLPAARVARA